MNLIKNIFYFSLISIFLIFTSCQTLQQDKYVSIMQEGQEEVIEVELKICKLESDFLLSEISSEELNLSLDSCITKIDSIIQEEKVELEAQSKLNALKGKCLLLQGKRANAKASYEKAKNLYKGEVNTAILAYRLNLTKEDIEEAKISSELKGFLTLEKALNLYGKKDYRKTGAKFDEAFMNIPLPYRQAYEKLRNSCWALRESSNLSNDINSIIIKEKINLGEMLYLVQGSSQLLYKYTASKSLSENELYKRVEKASLFEAASLENQKEGDTTLSSNINEEKITRDSLLTRRLFARFLWNLRSDLKMIKGTKNKYSNLFAGEKISPVSDISYYDRDFDAILSSVEDELLDLPDAENFYPEKPLSAAECGKAIKKIK
ncbi:MAG: hypothetical protein K6E78_03095 [Treponema sp.]|nr:hypothetical protein [Treponema sp.]